MIYLAPALSLSHNYICWQRIMRFDTKAKEAEGRENHDDTRAKGYYLRKKNAEKREEGEYRREEGEGNGYESREREKMDERRERERGAT